MIDAYVNIWIGTAAIAFSIIIVVVIWAVKNKQMKNSERANSLPLDAAIPDENQKD